MSARQTAVAANTDDAADGMLNEVCRSLESAFSLFEIRAPCAADDSATLTVDDRLGNRAQNHRASLLLLLILTRRSAEIQRSAGDLSRNSHSGCKPEG